MATSLHMGGLLKPCGNGACERLVPSGVRFCRDHAAADGARRNAKVTRFGYSRPHWRGLRARRLIFAGGMCELRLPGCTGHATHVHLRAELAGNHDAATLEDCRACCASCSGAIDAPRARG